MKKKYKEYKEEDYVHCKFCDWKCLKFYHNKRGKLVLGWRRLKFHTEFEHLEQILEIRGYNDHEGIYTY